MLDKSKIKEVALRVVRALDDSEQIELISNSFLNLTIKEAYRIAQEIEFLRIDRNERVVGVKIGFTNRNIWKEYNATAPIVGAMYNTTVKNIDKTFSIKGLSEPKIEPEIILKLKKAPKVDMEFGELLDCISHISHGFEVVHSIFRNWQFKTVDTIIAFGLHGALLCGPFRNVSNINKSNLVEELSNFNITLFCNGKKVDEGYASNVLGAGPLEALRHILLDNKNLGCHASLKPGDIVTTGTLTGAFSIKSGEIWSTELHGIKLDSLETKFN